MVGHTVLGDLDTCPGLTLVFADRQPRLSAVTLSEGTRFRRRRRAVTVEASAEASGIGVVPGYAGVPVGEKVRPPSSELEHPEDATSFQQ